MPILRPSIQCDAVDGGVATEFTLAMGFPQEYGQTLEEITRDNTDGMAARTKGKRAERFTLRTHRDVASAAAAKTMRQLYAEYAGCVANTLTLIINGEAVTYTDPIVWSVRPIEIRPLVNPVGALDANSTLLLVDDWEIQLTLDS